MATRLYFIVAREVPIAVVFRRGPTRQVELLTWDLRTDEIVRGQWLKGRIYERRSDLSPSGDHLIYFAAKYETGLRTWTAVSRPPWLTAVAMWPKGDAWGGGGLFDDERRIRLNHRASEMALAEAFRLPSTIEVIPFGAASGWGEDDPIHHVRLQRDGWRWIDRRSAKAEHSGSKGRWLTFDPPIAYRRRIGEGGAAVNLEMSLEAIHERGGSWYVITWRLMEGEAVLRDLGRADWADAGPHGDLLLARDGRLWRLAPRRGRGWTDGDLREVADLTADAFEPRVAPDPATRWS